MGIKTYIAAALTLFTFNTIQADGIFRGVKGSTDFQIDNRLSYSSNSKGIETLTNNLILKYWDGDKLGLFGFANIPYGIANSPTSGSNGIKDITLGVGPRGTIGNLHFLSYISSTFPTGSTDSKPALGNGRTDVKLGIAGTYFINNKSLELDAVVERNFTGNTPSGNNVPNEIYVGFMAGGEVLRDVRAGVGITHLDKDDNSKSTGIFANFRYTISKYLHFELKGEKTIGTNNLPNNQGIMGIIRLNL